MKISSFQLFWKYLCMLVKSSFQYRVNAFFLSLSVFIRESVNVIIMYFLLKRFNNINGWTMNEMFFLYSLIFLTYSILVGFFAGIRNFPHLIHTGNFDKYLLKPMGILFQVISAQADYFASIGHGAVGLILFFTTADSLDLVWNITNITYYACAIIGRVLIQLSIWLLVAALSFWTVKSDEMIGFIFWNTRKFAGYPISIFPAFIKVLLMFIIPFAFVNYFPAQYFLRKNDLAQFWEGCLYITPFVGISMFIMVLLFWRISLKRYTSTGTVLGM